MLHYVLLCMHIELTFAFTFETRIHVLTTQSKLIVTRCNTIVFHPCIYVSIYQRVNYFTVTLTSLKGQVARCFTDVDVVLAVLSLFPYPDVLLIWQWGSVGRVSRVTLGADV